MTCTKCELNAYRVVGHSIVEFYDGNRTVIYYRIMSYFGADFRVMIIIRRG